jgi:predicted kinase
MSQARLIILVGNIGSGKSTVAKEYAKEGFRVICRDDMRTMLAAGGYLFEPALERAIHRASRALLENLMIDQIDVLIDETNMTKRGRKELISLGKLFNYAITGVVMSELSKAKSIANRAKDNLRGNGLYIWSQVWQKFNNAYDKPSLDEGFDSLIWKDAE